jgi:hypothetical protein
MSACTRTPTANATPVAGADGTIDRGWLDGASVAATHAPVGLTQSGIAANATTQLMTFDPNAVGMVTLHYMLVRGTRKIAGELKVLCDGTSPNVTDSATTAIGTTGVSFTATVVSGLVSLNIVVDNADAVTVAITLFGDRLTYPA